ncbi:MAG TPA: glycosyltransferase [Prolixibacteraceae bacterium]|nr:glycosyltransferase [Prolixibacteraceae bacterium]
MFGTLFWEFFLRKMAGSKNLLIISFSNGIILECYKTTFSEKLIAFEHWPFWITEKYPKLQQKIKSVYPKLKKIIVLTQHEKKVYNSMNCNNVEIIPNAYSFLPEKPASLTSKIVLSIGHFNEQKRRDLLIHAWKLVVEKNPDWSLIIIGEGKDRDKIVAEIESLGLKESVQIINPTPAIQPYYLNSSIFVLSSEFESFSLVLQEAKLSGVPCVCFDVISGPAEVINDGKDGFLVPFPQTREMADKINLLIENEFLRKDFGSFARTDALNRYNPEKIYAIWQDYLMEASF